MTREEDKYMKKIYLAHPISNDYEAQASIDTANKLRELGYEVYAAAENKSINDKTKDPTPVDIYDADVKAIMDCDIFVVNVTGGYQDGTISEIGVVSGLNEGIKANCEVINGKTPDIKDTSIFIPIIAYTTNSRLTNPQHHYGIPSAGANHLVLGMIDKWGSFVAGGVNGLLDHMEFYK